MAKSLSSDPSNRPKPHGFTGGEGKDFSVVRRIDSRDSWASSSVDNEEGFKSKANGYHPGQDDTDTSISADW